VDPLDNLPVSAEGAQWYYNTIEGVFPP